MMILDWLWKHRTQNGIVTALVRDVDISNRMTSPAEACCSLPATRTSPLTLVKVSLWYLSQMLHDQSSLPTQTLLLVFRYLEVKGNYLPVQDPFCQRAPILCISCVDRNVSFATDQPLLMHRHSWCQRGWTFLPEHALWLNVQQRRSSLTHRAPSTLIGLRVEMAYDTSFWGTSFPSSHFRVAQICSVLDLERNMSQLLNALSTLFHKFFDFHLTSPRFNASADGAGMGSRQTANDLCRNDRTSTTVSNHESELWGRSNTATRWLREGTLLRVILHTICLRSRRFSSLRRGAHIYAGLSYLFVQPILHVYLVLPDEQSQTTDPTRIGWWRSCRLLEEHFVYFNLVTGIDFWPGWRLRLTLAITICMCVSLKILKFASGQDCLVFAKHESILAYWTCSSSQLKLGTSFPVIGFNDHLHI